MPAATYHEYLAEATAAETGRLLPAATAAETGQFNVFNIADLLATRGSRPPMSFGRRPFYKISLMRGRSRVEVADRTVEVAGPALWLVTSRVPYRWHPHDAEQVGCFCVFTDEFLVPVKGSLVPDELPVFQPAACPVLPLGEDDYAAVAVIFEKMTREMTSGYAYKHELLRAYLLELIFLAQKLLPPTAATLAPPAAARLAARFTELLERQFPLATPGQALGLRTARDFADALAVHVNHLNRVLKDATGRTTTALIAVRLGQEARQLLRHTTWTVAEVADGLGFTDTAHFCHFFKRQTGCAPGEYRGGGVAVSI
ncbi:helix-turn-helix transcriptional regulator [Hymenobacter sp. RP-2-7]|uniref:Helix-turn-helix transcriptional regulator n=1 Tax=Hymenobacter polaris TaxID=2682546 RepID=A0A7Y0FMM1_9BACT|nr:helix-turn-helix transcriptional regulator [Hymenobacter polaris]NML65595.1 helix-turn-helix transcriptional regulator [Hymenobacter polaris]